MIGLLQFPHPALRHPASDFNPAPFLRGKPVEALVNRMIDVMVAWEGVGLAAPQLGMLARLVVIGIPGREPYALANPELVDVDTEHNTATEGCLSLPGFACEVERPTSVDVRAVEPVTWKPLEFTAVGFEARVIQHELDHLRGCLIWHHHRHHPRAAA